MSFIESYKRLDNLCKDIFTSETGVTTYITNMESLMYNRFQITNWDSDYKKLKHYRYIRNQIVHENNVDEGNICNADDLYWVEQFYQRIINQTDPLTLYQKALYASKQQASKQQTLKPKKTEEPAKYKEENERTYRKLKFALTIIIIIALLSVSAILLLLWR